MLFPSPLLFPFPLLLLRRPVFLGDGDDSASSAADLLLELPLRLLLSLGAGSAEAPEQPRGRRRRRRRNSSGGILARAAASILLSFSDGDGNRGDGDGSAAETGPPPQGHGSGPGRSSSVAAAPAGENPRRAGERGERAEPPQPQWRPRPGPAVGDGVPGGARAAVPPPGGLRPDLEEERGGGGGGKGGGAPPPAAAAAASRCQGGRGEEEATRRRRRRTGRRGCSRSLPPPSFRLLRRPPLPVDHPGEGRAPPVLGRPARVAQSVRGLALLPRLPARRALQRRGAPAGERRRVRRARRCGLARRGAARGAGRCESREAARGEGAGEGRRRAARAAARPDRGSTLFVGGGGVGQRRWRRRRRRSARRADRVSDQGLRLLPRRPPGLFCRRRRPQAPLRPRGALAEAPLRFGALGGRCSVRVCFLCFLDDGGHGPLGRGRRRRVVRCEASGRRRCRGRGCRRRRAEGGGLRPGRGGREGQRALGRGCRRRGAGPAALVVCLCSRLRRGDLCRLHAGVEASRSSDCQCCCCCCCWDTVGRRGRGTTRRAVAAEGEEGAVRIFFCFLVSSSCSLACFFLFYCIKISTESLSHTAIRTRRKERKG